MATSESARMAYNAGDCTAETVGLDEFAWKFFWISLK
jgi:hypothetical protein